MDYDVGKIAKLYNYVFDTQPNSPERITRLEKLNEADQEALYDYDIGIRSGRIKKTEVEEMAGQRSYEWYKKKMKFNESGAMQEVSKFALDCPALYAEYRARYKAEQGEALRKRNGKLMGYL